MNPFDTLYNRIEENKLWEKDIFLKRHEYLNQADTVDSNLYYIKSGSIKMFIINDSEEHIVRFGYKNNFITSIKSFVSDKPSELNVQAIKRTELLMISKLNYFKFIGQNPDIKLLYDEIMKLLLLQQMEREIDILITSPKERFQRVFKRSPQLFQEIPNKYIASYLRMSPETLSRLKKS